MDIINLNEIEQLIDRKQLFSMFDTECQNKLFNFEQMIDFYYDKPIEFAEDLLRFQADSYQQEIMTSIRDNKRTAVRSGQGIGKTATVSCIIIWYLCTRYNSKILATAPNITQLHTVLWAEIAKWLQGSIMKDFITHTKTRLYMNGYEKSWFAFPKTATTKEGIAGQHAEHLLMIADEASGIKDDILETLLGTITGSQNKLLFISNPTRTSGVFYDAFHKNRNLYNCIHVDAETSIRVDRENIDMLAKSYGKDSNVYLVRVKGEFPTQEDDVFIGIADIEAAVAREWLTNKPNAIKIGVDVARFGDDSTVIAPNVGGNIKHLIIKRGNATTETTGNIIRIAKEERDAYSECHKEMEGEACDLPVIAIIDDTGIGGGVTDQLRELINQQNIDWLYVVPVNAAESINHEHYYDATTYMYGTVRELMKSEEISLCESADMIGQFSSRKYTIQSNGKIKIESKKEMKKRGLKSPDIADAITLAFWPVNIEKLINGKIRKSSRRK